MNTISLHFLDPKVKPYAQIVRKTLVRGLGLLRKNCAVLDVYFIRNKEMRFLNKNYRGKDKATNILSFEEPKQFPHPELDSRKKSSRGRRMRKGVQHLGELYLNISYIQKEARVRGTPYSVLFTQYSIHGLLHLLGYKHSTKNDRIQMEKREKFLISNI